MWDPRQAVYTASTGQEVGLRRVGARSSSVAATELAPSSGIVGSP